MLGWNTELTTVVSAMHMRLAGLSSRGTNGRYSSARMPFTVALETVPFWISARMHDQLQLVLDSFRNTFFFETNYESGFHNVATYGHAGAGCVAL